ncbi:hypothetical protein [Flavobacterium alkalisoli]|uniref:hypothetical protein n=1 Tax=Flavobacterium alkalisoli TaxID=2602769 RepID=UPI003A8FA0F6
MKKITFLFFTIILIISCKESAMHELYGVEFYFKDAQPVMDSELNSFPLKFRGVYKITGQERDLCIADKYIYYEYLIKGSINKSELSSLKDSVVYSDGKLILVENGLKTVYEAKQKGDTIYFSTMIRDTVFGISENDKLKHIKGSLVLNKKDSVYWNVRMLSTQKDTLIWSYFSDKEDCKMLKPIVKDITINKDTTKVFLQPTRREFVKLLSKGTFNSNIYIRQKE